MHILGCLFGLLIVIVVIILLAPMILMQIVRSFFGTSTRQKSNPFGQQRTSQQQNANHAHQNAGQQQTDYAKRAKPNSRQRRSKIFEKGEGEYVDFTEIKD